MFLRSNPAKLDRLMKEAQAGVLRPAIDSAFALDDAPAAFDHFRAGGKRGRILLGMAAK